jgi:hypothetical protein
VVVEARAGEGHKPLPRLMVWLLAVIGPAGPIPCAKPPVNAAMRVLSKVAGIGSVLGFRHEYSETVPCSTTPRLGAYSGRWTRRIR